MYASVSTCRLCHREADADSPNIFESSMEFCKDVSIAEISQHLWAVHVSLCCIANVFPK